MKYSRKVKPKRPQVSKEKIRASILGYLSSKKYTPLSQEQLFDKLSLPKNALETFFHVITDLLREGEVVIKKNILSLKEKESVIVTGILRMHARGFGFVIPDDSKTYPQDFFIPRHLTYNAVDGDHVEVEVLGPSHPEKGPEGRIISILKRAHDRIAGIINYFTSEGKAYVYAPLLGTSKTVYFPIHKLPLELKVGDRVVLSIEDWGAKEKPVKAQFQSYIGNILDPSVDVDAAALEFGISQAFSKEALLEAKKWGNSVKKSDYKDRADLRDLDTITIDPTTARDFDDGLYVKKDPQKGYFLAVHIADVAHYVKPNSPLDKEARQRCNSTYFPGKCIPMLPEELSNGLCSLKPEVDRLAVTVLMDFDLDGNLLHQEIVRSVIKSQKRFSYEEAKEVLDGKKKHLFLPMLEEMVELCYLLKKKRKERGSIDFAIPELVLDIDEKGEPTGTYIVEYDITHQLVEEFMLKANEIVATQLENQGKKLLFRVHEEPSTENFQDFFEQVRSLGFTLPSHPKQSDLQDLFDEVKKTPFSQQLTVAFIRSMKLACYSSENQGHFGLALSHYTHFTSPIRRYSDLIIQRLLFNDPVDLENLEAIALACSEKERVSFKAESSVKQLKKLRLLKRWVTEHPFKSFNALVTKIKPFGLFFELPELALEGFLHISELGNDYFIYQEQSNTIVGSHTGKTYRISTPIEVVNTEVNLILQESKWKMYFQNESFQRAKKAWKKRK